MINTLQGGYGKGSSENIPFFWKLKNGPGDNVECSNGTWVQSKCEVQLHIYMHIFSSKNKLMAWDILLDGKVAREHFLKAKKFPCRTPNYVHPIFAGYLARPACYRPVVTNCFQHSKISRNAYCWPAAKSPSYAICKVLYRQHAYFTI